MQVPDVLNGNSVAQRSKSRPFTVKLSTYQFFRNAHSATRRFCRCYASQSSRLSSVFGTGFTREWRLPLHVFQPHSNPKYHYSKCLYGSLALFETPNHALQLIDNTLLTS